VQADGLRLVVLDLDGTLHRGSEVVPDAPAFVRAALKAGLFVRAFTNNSAAWPEATAAKLRGMGLPFEPEWIWGTGPLAVRVAMDRGWRKVWVVGEPSLVQGFLGAGVSVSQDAPDAVVVGIDRSFTYDSLALAADLVRGGAVFVATNRDATYPLEGDRLQPGAGSVVAAIETASGVRPEVLGKPEPLLLRSIRADAGVSPSETLVVGDRLDTDIAAGQADGCRTWLVTGGVEPAVPDGQAGGSLGELARTLGLASAYSAP
jgi:4-nitrophenyl phosphatase